MPSRSSWRRLERSSRQPERSWMRHSRTSSDWTVRCRRLSSAGRKSFALLMGSSERPFDGSDRRQTQRSKTLGSSTTELLRD